MVERTSKCLTQRSRPNIAQIITIDELCSMAKIVDLLNQESMRMTNRVSNGLALSLQVCTVFYCYFPQCGKTRNSLSRKEIFREINYLVTSLVKPRRVRVNFRNFHKKCDC